MMEEMMMIKGLTLTGFGTLSEGQVAYFDTLRDGGVTNESFPWYL